MMSDEQYTHKQMCKATLSPGNGGLCSVSGNGGTLTYELQHGEDKDERLTTMYKYNT